MRRHTNGVEDNNKVSLLPYMLSKRRMRPPRSIAVLPCDALLAIVRCSVPLCEGVAVTPHYATPARVGPGNGFNLAGERMKTQIRLKFLLFRRALTGAK